MHKFVVLFMLAFTVSLIAVMVEPVFAEDMSNSTSNEQMTDTQPTDESETNEQTTDNEETPDESSDNMKEYAMAPHLDSPLKQMSMGTDPHEIQCKSGYKLVFKASNWSPACIKESSFQTLLTWGWASNHDPSHEDMQKMMDEYAVTHPKETEKEDHANMNENMDVTEKSTTNSTSADVKTPQNHTVNLSESMDMGTQ